MFGCEFEKLLSWSKMDVFVDSYCKVKFIKM